MADGAARAARTAPNAGRPAPRRRPASTAAAAAPPRRTAGRPVPLFAGLRWLRVLLLAAGVVVGLPLAHAMFGEVVALLGGATTLGFLVGRWTAPGRG